MAAASPGSGSLYGTTIAEAIVADEFRAALDPHDDERHHHPHVLPRDKDGFASWCSHRKVAGGSALEATVYDILDA